MPKFSAGSIAQLATCDERLIKIFKEVVKIYDIKVTEGFRNKADQDAAFEAGNSKLKWPNGKHNKQPSVAVDVYPFPISFSNDRSNIYRYYYLAGLVLGIAHQMDIKIRWGGNWDMDNDFTDNSFNDYCHFEVLD